MHQNRFSKWVNYQVSLKLDKEPFSSLPLKTRIGIFTLIASFVVGYGTPLLLIMLAAIDEQWVRGIIGGTFFYIVSWVIGAVGLSLAGKNCIKYPVYFFAKLVKTLFPRKFEEKIDEKDGAR
jgi:hypothetical protein